MNRVKAKLAELLKRKRPDGSQVYTDEQVRDAFALLVLNQKAPASVLSADTKKLLAEFAVKLGFVGAGAVPERLPELIQSYLKKHPLPPELSRELEEALSEK